MHPNKNELLALYYGEDVQPGKIDILAHLDSCESCRHYLKILNSIEKKLQQWQNDKPSALTFERIMENISTTSPALVRSSLLIPITPILQIAFGICFIISIVYIIKSQLIHLPIWQVIKSIWLVETFGSLSFVLFLFFCIGTFFTLSLAPILYFESSQVKKEKFLM